MKDVLLAFVLLNASCHCAFSRYVTLDIQNHGRVASLFKNIYDDTEYHTFMVKDGLGVIKLCDDDRLIWSGDESNYSESVIIHLLSGEYNLMIINKADGLCKDDEYFEFLNGRWSPIDLIDYNNILHNIVISSVLDIGDYKNNLHLSVNTVLIGNAVHMYTPIRGKKIIELLDDGLTIWKGDIRFEFLALVAVYYRKGRRVLMEFSIRNDDSQIIHCFYKRFKDDIWRPIGEDEYRSYAFRIDFECILDIKSIHHTKMFFEIIYHHPYGTPSLMYISKGYAFATQVIDGDTVIWESDFDTRCAYATVHFKDDEAILLQIHLETKRSHGDVFYIKNEEEWIMIDRDLYYEKLEAYDDLEDSK